MNFYGLQEIFHGFFMLKIVFLRARRIAQRLRVIAVLPEGTSLDPSTLIGYLINTRNSSFLGPDVLFWFSCTYAHMSYTHAYTDT